MGVNMFEEEAEEYYYKTYPVTLNIGEEERKKKVTDMFITCAEFGYNKAKEDADKMKSQFLELCNLKDMRIAELEKANEWHYSSKGELPKDEKDMLMSEQLILLTKLKGTNNLSISIGQYNFSTQEFSYPRIVGLTDVIAWKEIALPKESK